MAANVVRRFRTVPGAAVRHLDGGGGRSYTRLFRWSFGDSSLVRLHPRYAYPDVPDMVETLTFGTAIIGCLALEGVVPPAMVGVWAGLVASSEFVAEWARVRSHHPGSSTGAVLEATMIRISGELGRFLGPLSRGDASCVFRRFDYPCTGEWKPLEMRFTRAKFALFSVSVPLAYWLGLLWG